MAMSLAAPLELMMPEAHVRTRHLPRRWMSWATGAFLTSSVAGAFMHRGLMVNAWSEAKSISARWWFLLGALVIAHRLVIVAQQWAAVGTVGFGRMAVSTEANLGASNAVVGGSAIGTALRVAMWRSWGVGPLRASVALFITALCPSFAMWLVAGAHTWPDLVTGRADRVDVIIGVGAVGFLVAPLVFWGVALSRPTCTAWLAARFAGFADRLAARVPAVRRMLFRWPIPTVSEEFRASAWTVVRRRGAMILGGAIVSQVLLACILLASLHAVGAGAGLDGWEVVRAFALVRVVSSFVPIPGGIGVMELGLVGALTTAGSTRPEAVAALAIYRGLTFFLPILTGTVGALVWRRRQSVPDVATSERLTPLLASIGS